MSNKSKKARILNRALALLFAVVMALTSSATAISAIAYSELWQLEALQEDTYLEILQEDGYIVPPSALIPAAPGARTMQEARARANYRNLTMTPGGSYEEMRFTWHSRSEIGEIRIYDAAGALVVGKSAISRQLGHSFESVNAGTDPQPRNTIGHWFNGVTLGNYWVHQVIVNGLTADTSYTYILQGRLPGAESDFVSAPKFFRTAPSLASARSNGFTFTAAGDPQIGVNDSFRGSGMANQAGSYAHDYVGWMDTLRLQGEHAPHSQFMLLLGDQVHNNGGSAVASRARSQFMYDILLAPPEFHSLPIVPVIGNHERGNVNGSMWNYHYNTPLTADNIRQHEGGSQAYLRFDYYMIWGNMLFIQLDSETRNMNPARQQWLEGIIEEYQDQVDWTVAAWHRPIYSVHRHSTLGEKNDMINAWLPILDTLGIDVVFNGHCHVYSRTHQMYNHAPLLNQNWIDPVTGVVTFGGPEVTTNAVLNPTGTLHMALNSGSGSGFRSVKYMGLRDYISAYNQNFLRNFSVVNVDQHTFEIRTYQVDDNASGTGTVSLVDTFTIVKNSEGNTVPVGVNLTSNLLIPEEIISVNNPTSLVAAEGIEITAEALGLPTSVAIETNLNNNLTHYADTRTGIIGATGSRDRGHLHHANYYGVSVRTVRNEVNWDLSEILALAPAERENRIFTVTGELVSDAFYTRQFPAAFGRLPHETVGGTAHNVIMNQWWFDADYEENTRHRNWTFPHFGTPNNVHLLRSITNPYDIKAEAQIIFGSALPETLEAPFRISELGRSEYHHFARTDSAFLSDAFDRDVFMSWPLVRTAAGFGTPRIDNGAVPIHRNATVLARPGGINANATFHYFSKTFVLPENFSSEYVTEVLGSHRIDDNLILYINGIEIYRMNTSTVNLDVRIGMPINWGAYVGHNTDAQHRTFHLNFDFNARNTGYARQANNDQVMFDAGSRSNLLDALQPGVNVLTAVVGDNSATSSDLWFDLELTIGYDGPPPTDCPPIEELPPVVFSGNNPNVLRAYLDERDVILETAGNLGIFTHHSPFVIPEGRTLTVVSTLNIQGNAELIIDGTLVVQNGGRVNNQGGAGGTIVIAPGGTLENDGHVENVTNSAVINKGTIINNARFEIRAGTSLRNCGEVEGILNIHRYAIKVSCENCEVS